MNIRTRRRLGVALLAGATLAAIALQLATGQLVQERETRQVTDAGFKHAILITDTLIVKTSYAIPLAAMAAGGLLCLILPARRPPIIH